MITAFIKFEDNYIVRSMRENTRQPSESKSFAVYSEASQLSRSPNAHHCFKHCHQPVQRLKLRDKDRRR